MLQKIDKYRLDMVLQVLENAKIRFRVAEVVKKTGYDKGNVSSFLSGKRAISDNFYATFMKTFAPGEDFNLHEHDVGYHKQDVEKELLKKRVADLEKIVSFLEREIESTKESTPLKKVDSAK